MDVSSEISWAISGYIFFTIVITLNYFLQKFRTKETAGKRYLRTLSQVSPAIMFLCLIWLIYKRFKFTSQVCLCDFKEDYYTLRNKWH